MSMETLTRAWEVLQDAYQAQMEGDYDRAVELYNRLWSSIPRPRLIPSWAGPIISRGALKKPLRMQARHRARSGVRQPLQRHRRVSDRVGPVREAIPWLEQATAARRYEPRHFPHYNLGRAYLGKEMYSHAIRCFQEALEIEPRYSLAQQALASLRRMVN